MLNIDAFVRQTENSFRPLPSSISLPFSGLQNLACKVLTLDSLGGSSPEPVTYAKWCKIINLFLMEFTILVD